MNILITGSEGIIGKSIFNKLNTENHIFELDINNKLNPVDCTNEEQVDRFFKNLKKEINNLDAVINCLGNSDSVDNNKLKSLEDVSINTFKSFLDINLISIFIIIKAYMKYFSESKGNIINISSLYSEVAPFTPNYEGYFKHPAYIASKSGLVGMSKYLAVLCSKNDIKINCIAPSAVLDTINNSNFIDKFKNLVPLNRGCSIDDILNVIKMLLENNLITGQNILLDGGYTLW
jgi:NAD(P)-dependent dehydrogenase (short-subunit alcohol dehydrogenase family)